MGDGSLAQDELDRNLKKKKNFLKSFNLPPLRLADEMCPLAATTVEEVEAEVEELVERKEVPKGSSLVLWK